MFTIPINKIPASTSDLSKLSKSVGDKNYMDRFKSFLQMEYDTTTVIDSPIKNNEQDRKICILYIDDEQSNLTGFKATFRGYYNILTASTKEEAFSILENNNVDIILSDVRMPICDGVELLAEVKELYPNISRILISAYSDSKTLMDAINNASVCRFITKPWVEEDIHDAILAACPPTN